MWLEAQVLRVRYVDGFGLNWVGGRRGFSEAQKVDSLSLV